MLYLLLDIGNSNIKIAYSEGKNIKSVISKGYSKESFSADLIKILKSFNLKPDKAGVSCIDIKMKKIIKSSLTEKYNISPLFINPKSKLPIRLDYEKSLGSDRISSAVGAVSIFGNKTNILIIDFGTCTTYNLIIKGVYSGGLITPGINTAIKSLTKFTSLPKVNYNFPYALFSKNTKENISWGIIYQSLFTTEEIINRACMKYKNLKVITTGGYPEINKKLSNIVDCNFKYLVLNGIKDILNYQN